MRSDLHRFNHHLKRHGLIEAVKQTAFAALRLHAMTRYQTKADSFDEENNVRTSEKVSLTSVTVNAASKDHSNPYEPAPVNAILDILNVLMRSYEKYTFVDLGSGMGRVILLASQFNFQRVVGVEFATEFHQQAIENLRRYPRQKMRCQLVECQCIDAKLYDIPQTNAVLFMFNPFKPELFRLVINQIVESYVCNPRDILLVTLNSGQEHNEIVQDSRIFRRKQIFNLTQEARFYTNNPYRLDVYQIDPTRHSC